jgi:hypothetical protein
VSVVETQRRPTPFLAFVTATFLLGWLLGVVCVFKVWSLLQAPRWMMFSGAGYVSFVLAPIVLGVAVTVLSGKMCSRGWGGSPVRMLAVGVCGLVLGLVAL